MDKNVLENPITHCFIYYGNHNTTIISTNKSTIPHVHVHCTWNVLSHTVAKIHVLSIATVHVHVY